MNEGDSFKKEEKKSCFIVTVIILICLAFLILMGASVGVLTSFDANAEANYNWSRFTFGSLVLITFTVLVILWSHILRKMLSSSDEE
jgi:heme/copper-type cytochrome/quinol oxidase subunit 2